MMNEPARPPNDPPGPPARPLPDRSGQQIVADNIATLRRARGISEDDLAATAGVHPSLIELIESGRTSLPSATLARIAAGLGVTVQRLSATG